MLVRPDKAARLVLFSALTPLATNHDGHIDDGDCR